tara:strand:+ start:711 stop:917 length:207 start_codon:yes stop_codon:yes gene_type:complete
MADKKTKTKDISLQEIKSQLIDSRKELFNLRFKKVSGQLENTSQIKKIKKKIARLLTKNNKKELNTNV